jgi:CheY-like chemotaxis protein
MLSVLIIEDDFMLAEEWQYFLTKETEHEVKFVAKASEALDLIEQHVPDILIVDLYHRTSFGSLKGDNGIRIMGPLKREYPKLKIIAATAYNHTTRSVTTKTVVHNLGADYFLSKPFDVEDLLIKVKEAEESIKREKV